MHKIIKYTVFSDKLHCGTYCGLETEAVHVGYLAISVTLVYSLSMVLNL